MAAVTELVSQLDKQLQDDGIEDEVSRYQMIMEHLQKEEERLLKEQNLGEKQDEEDNKVPVNEEL